MNTSCEVCKQAGIKTYFDDEDLGRNLWDLAMHLLTHDMSDKERADVLFEETLKRTP